MQFIVILFYFWFFLLFKNGKGRKILWRHNVISAAVSQRVLIGLLVCDNDILQVVLIGKTDHILRRKDRKWHYCACSMGHSAVCARWATSLTRLNHHLGLWLPGHFPFRKITIRATFIWAKYRSFHLFLPWTTSNYPPQSPEPTHSTLFRHLPVRSSRRLASKAS